MKKLMKMTLGAACMAVLGGALSAHAISITPTSGVLDVTRWTGLQTSQSQISDAVEAIIGNSTELFKVDPGESGSLAGSYNGSYTANTGTITYTGGTVISPTAYLLVKDGQGPPGWYLFNMTALGWNGTDQIDLSGFWVGTQGAISHLTLYSGDGGDIPGTPDGGATVFLLGAALAGFAALRRKLA